MNPAIEALVKERHGVVTRQELAALGVSSGRLYRQIAAGEWRRAGRRIVVHASVPEGLIADSLVTALWVPDAILTGPSAAVLHPHPAWTGQSFGGQRAMVIAPNPGRGPWRSVRHPGAVTAPHPLGFKVADHHTTLVDLLRFLPWKEAAAVGAKAIRLRLTTAAALLESVDGLASAEGVAQARRIALALVAGAESGPEIDLQLLLRRARIQGWLANHTIKVSGRFYRPDICFLREGVALEYDGVSEHAGAGPFHPDRKRRNNFGFEDWQVINVTKQMLSVQSESEELVAGVRRLLRKRRAELADGRARR